MKNNNENQILKVISSISVLYEDNHLLVVEKPVNMPVQEDASGDPDLLSVLKQDIKMRYQKPGNVYLGLVHRLDRPTGGVMVFAKTSKAASRLSEQVRSRSFGKVYLAVLHGVPEPGKRPAGTLPCQKQG
jgi:23S rRNA pseudouridine1911/1915/1917 synthase